MNAIYSSSIEPDPSDALDVLAFVLCPVDVFVPCGSHEERAAITEMLAPAKEEAVRKWLEADFLRTAN